MKFLLSLLLVVPSYSFAGEQKYKSNCAACHGPDGKATTSIYPNLAGQNKDYLIQQLNKFKDGTRPNAMMKAYASMLTDEEIKSISEYLSKLECK